MKLLGRSMEGGVIIETEFGEYLAMQEAGRALASLPALELAAPVAMDPRLYPRPKEPQRPNRGKSRQVTAVAGDRRRGNKVKPAKKIRECAQCGKPVTGQGRYKYCSDECAKKADEASKHRSYLRKAGKLGKKTEDSNRSKNCVVCDKRFIDTSQANNRKTCSDKCRDEHRKFLSCGVSNVPRDPPPRPNPADPLLTDDERKAARLEIIKRSAEKYRGN